MRRLLALAVLLLPSPALAQFPPPGGYDCYDAAQIKIGSLSLQEGGDYQWVMGDDVAFGQMTSSGNNAEAFSGPLADKHWTGSFVTQMDRTMFTFETDDGQVLCY